MISFEMEDLIGVLQGLKPYLIAIAVFLIAAIVITVAVKGMAKPKKALIRKGSWLAALAAIAITVNMICFGPMSTLITLATGITSRGKYTFPKIPALPTKTFEETLKQAVK